jgi:hypothetical protein
MHHPWGNDASLPADRAKLRPLLLSLIPRKLPAEVPKNPATRGVQFAVWRRNQLMFWAQMVMQQPIQPAVRAAAYQVLAGFPGVKMKPGVKDPKGRTGTALWLWAGKNPINGVYIVDPATGYLLAQEEVTTRAFERFPPGTFLTYSAYAFRWASTLPSR